MPSKNHKRSRLGMYGRVIPSSGPALHGLGVTFPQKTVLDNGTGFEHAQSEKGEESDIQPAEPEPQDGSNSKTFRSWPRQTPTKTMLDTYALLRGRLSGGGRGPLYREGFTYPMWKPKPEDIHPRISPPTAWGHLYVSKTSTPFGANNVSDYEDKEDEKMEYAPTPDLAKISESKRRTYSEILNWIGYLSINGKVTDPDSKMEVLRALAGIRGDSPPLPGFHESLLASVMCPSELEEYYIRFVLDVDNENDPDRDNEGNPLDYRISPDTFLKWAEGAKKKENPKTAEVEERVREEELKGAKPPGNPKTTRWSVLRPQYDEETGQPLSPTYSVDEHPSPLMSPQGVDMDHVPHMFYHMLPEVNLMLARAAYYDGGIDLSLKVSSRTEVITDEQLADTLGNGDQELGKRRIIEARQDFETLMAKRDAQVSESCDMMLVCQSMRATVNQLENMVFARRQEISAPERRARVTQLLGEWEENLIHQTAKAENLTKICRADIVTLRERAGQFLSELQGLERPLAGDRRRDWAGV